MQDKDQEKLSQLLNQIKPENSVQFLRRNGWNDMRVTDGKFEYWKKPGKYLYPDNIFSTLEALEEELECLEK